MTVTVTVDLYWLHLLPARAQKSGGGGQGEEEKRSSANAEVEVSQVLAGEGFSRFPHPTVLFVLVHLCPQASRRFSPSWGASPPKEDPLPRLRAPADMAGSLPLDVRYPGSGPRGAPPPGKPLLGRLHGGRGGPEEEAGLGDAQPHAAQDVHPSRAMGPLVSENFSLTSVVPWKLT